MCAAFLFAAPALCEAQGLSVSPTAATGFTGIVRGVYQPFFATYTLQNPSATPTQWFATSSQGWLSLASTAGTVPGLGTDQLTVSVDQAQADKLGPGSYSATLRVFDLTNAKTESRTVLLTLEASGASLSVFPYAGFSTSMGVGGVASPNAKTYAFANLGTSSMSWSASTSASWLTVSDSGGVLQPGILRTLVVGIDPVRSASLPMGSYVARFRVDNLSGGLGSVEYDVTLNVSGAPPALAVTPASGLSLSGVQGGPFPGSRDYTLSNGGGSSLAWSATPDRSWIEVSAASGLLAPGQTAVVRVSAAAPAAQLGMGSYAGSVVFRNDSGGPGTTARTVTLDVQGPLTAMQVTPATGLSSSGPPGGRFTPDEENYTIANQGNAPMAWKVTTNAPWALITNGTGTLAPGAQTAVQVAIDQQIAGTLPPGSYAGSVFFTNLTDGVGNTQRTIDLTVQSMANPLSLSPSTGFTAFGPPGGPLSPNRQDYVLRNQSSAALSWVAVRTVNWIEISSYGGSLAAGAQANLSVAIDEAQTALLPTGVHEGFVAIGDPSSSAIPLLFKVRLQLAAGSTTNSSSLSQFGITWTFDRPYPVGQFANGDWWVQGPVRIVSIDPPSVVDGTGRVTNGSMVNPDPRLQSQGYDSTMFAQYSSPGSYQDALNVALNVSPASPLVLPPSSSLVSSVSRAQPALRPQLQSAAILTVLAQPAPAGSFRPAYCGDTKTIEFHESQLQYSRLARLAPVASTPSLSVVEAWFERPWVDHIPDWVGRYHHPTENMPDYGREICDRIGTASLMLNLSFSDAQKKTLLVRLVQVGIDFYGVVEAGGHNNWPAGGGHHSGRKWPILFAGILLNDVAMGSIGFDPEIAFNEDDQTFYVEETSPGVYNWGYGGYGPQHVGLPEWGNQHAKNLGQDDVQWFGNPYRTCCTANVWWGELLSAHVMGARPLWNHEPLFDYQDRYLEMARSQGQVGWTIGWTAFPLEMWDTYRAGY